MKLLQRVTTLIRANINDLIDRAEDPEKMIKQLIVDLNNQVIQVKTTVAQSLADQHLMERRLEQAREEADKCQRRAEQAVERDDDALARTALARYNSFQRTIEETSTHLEQQRKDVADLKLALSQLEMKIGEVTRERDVLLARQRRAVAKEKLSKMKSGMQPEKLEELLDAIGGYVDRSEANAAAAEELQRDSSYYKLTKLDEDAKVDEQLAALKAKHNKAA